MTKVKRMSLMSAGVVALFLTTAPAMASLFEIVVANTPTNWTRTPGDSTTGNLTASTSTDFMNPMSAFLAPLDPDGAPAVLYWPIIGFGGSFSLTMNLSGITATSANGTGSFTLADTTNDLVKGDFTGTWSIESGKNIFSGVLSNVQFVNTSGDGLFDGSESVPMSFDSASLWVGTINEWTGPAAWFSTTSSFDVPNGGVFATVNAVPVPAAALLGVLGLGAAGLKLRRFV